MAWPSITSFTKRDPAALVVNFPVEVLWLVVLTDLMAVALTTPPSKLTCSVVAELVAATPVLVVFDAAVVSMVPVKSAFGTFTEAAVLEWVTPTFDVQPRTTKADRPDFNVLPT
jgi:hypothetical protein